MANIKASSGNHCTEASPDVPNTQNLFNRYNLKLQSCDGKAEDIDTFLSIFEQKCRCNNVPRAHWIDLMSELLRGDARTALRSIPDYYDKDYDEVKQKLLKHFNKTEEFYRKKFHSLKMSNKDQPQYFIDNVVSSLKSWLTMAEIDLMDAQAVLEMFVIDKILQICTKDVFALIKQRKVKTVDQLVRALSDYMDSRPDDEICNTEFYANIIQNRYHSLPNRSSNQNKLNTHGWKHCKVEIVAVVNDAVGTLMSAAHGDRNCEIGLILGTGCNACYMEYLDNVGTWKNDEDHHPNQVIINTEWGAFGDNGCLDFMRTEYDRELDTFSINPGKQIMEKMISGMYMGEIVRLVLERLTNEGLLFRSVDRDCALFERGRFYTKYVSEIESDNDEFFRSTKQVLDELHVESYTTEDCKIVKYVCTLISARAAFLAAAGKG
ncbi:Hexokinase-1 [Bulinus truncatus]|nr:Hexokinase-1 [Bulinus truncatus]